MHVLKPAEIGAAVKQIKIDKVEDNILVLTDNKFRSIIETSSINFELKSDQEQDALIDTFQAFLNSLGSPIQILIRIREIDLDGYIAELNTRADKEKLAIYRHQLGAYAEFVKGLVSVNRILSRQFYVIVSLDPAPKQDESLSIDQLNLRTEIVSKGLKRLGMHTKQLSSLEILNLFYSFYNPKLAKLQPLSTMALKRFHDILICRQNDAETTTKSL